MNNKTCKYCDQLIWDDEILDVLNGKRTIWLLDADDSSECPFSLDKAHHPTRTCATMKQARKVAFELNNRVGIEDRYVVKLSKLLNPEAKLVLGFEQASQVITWLLALPEKPKAAAQTYVKGATVTPVRAPRMTQNDPVAPALPVGLYIQEIAGEPDKVYRLTAKKARNSTMISWRVYTINAYGNAVTTYLTRYQLSALPGLRAATDHEVHTLTFKFKRCAICGKRLRVQESVDRGIGPVCNRNQSAAAMIFNNRYAR